MRRWIKIRLKDNEHAHTAADIVEWWKGDRQAADNAEKAIRLYHDLTQGNTVVLTELFPFLADSLHRGAVAPRPARPMAAPVIRVQEKTEEDDINDLLSSF